MSAKRPDKRIGILYLAPWVGYGGSDKGTIDWFRHLDRQRYAPYLVTTQPSNNERVAEIYPYAEEVWMLPEFLAGQHMQTFIFDLIHTRGIGLVHIMNSRLGFDLLADLPTLPHPPGVVVQLHVEEPDKSGYVRYVATRYGNLVDAFSVSSRHLACVLETDYKISDSKIIVIPTGVDAQLEFNPTRVSPTESVRADCFNILFPGRLVEQKDPLLMTEVIRCVIEKHEKVHVHIVGEGPLEDEVRESIQHLGIETHFSFHPASRELARWYSACDLLLMTSVFEGVPYVIYEAMAMSTPVVAPALPGNRELMGDAAGLLIDPRDDVEAYAAAIDRLIEGHSARDLLGREARERVLSDYTIEDMVAAHEELYLRVQQSADAREERGVHIKAAAHLSTDKSIPTIWDEEPPNGAQWSEPWHSQRLRFVERPTQGQPLVSVIVPCFNHGRYLPECIDSILSQDYPELEVVVIDDASTEESTLNVLTDLETREQVTVLYQRRNSGPSAARNRGIKAAKGRYILPVDSDNLLLPGAIASLVEQLQAAGEQIGFIYPNCEYFGTRDDYFQPPNYNLHLLMYGNYCDTCSLIDRAVFDAGIRYAEDIVLGHEDWDFALTLAACGVRGEPARRATLRYRKEGFTRSDAVEYARHSFHEVIPERHPELFGDGDPVVRYGRYWSPAVDIKARWAPALSIVLITPIDLADEQGRTLLESLERQTCRDFELVLQCPTLPVPVPRTPLRRLPPGLCDDGSARLQEGLRIARGRYLLAVDAELASMAREAGFVERLLRTMLVRPGLEAIAFTDAGGHMHVPHRLLTAKEVCAPAHALFWERTLHERLPAELRLEQGFEAESLARAMTLHGIALQWRHAARAGEAPLAPTTAGRRSLNPAGGWMRFPTEHEQDPHRECEREWLAEHGPAIPALPWNAIRRWLGQESWIPPETDLLTRHREIDGERRIVRLGTKSPRGYELEMHLGAIQRFSPPGTVRLIRDAAGELRTVPRGSPRHTGEQELGHLEEAPLPLFSAVERAVLPNGTTTLVATDRDQLRTNAVRLEWLGFIESYPNKPLAPPDARLPAHGRISLLRCLDNTQRRHFYEACDDSNEIDAATVGELGILHLTAEPGSIPVWIDGNGHLSVGETPHRMGAGTPDLRKLIRWVGAPVSWWGFGHVHGRARSVLRRGTEAASIGLASWRETGQSTQTGGAERGYEAALVGYLYPEPGPDRRELFAAIHPITGDQLLTHHRLEATDMGYGSATSLGYVLIDMPLTGSLSMRRVAVPWASRFGLETRRA
jgi:glycosyltransferase involved in cell wall biosynthesis